MINVVSVCRLRINKSLRSLGEILRIGWNNGDNGANSNDVRTLKKKTNREKNNYQFLIICQISLNRHVMFRVNVLV